MRFVTSAAVWAAGLGVRLPRTLVRRRERPADGRAAREALRGLRGIAVLLALGLGLNGLGLCLCLPSTVKSADPHAYCPRSADHHAGAPATGGSVTASSAPCCASQVAPAFTARIDERDVLRHTLVAAAATDVSQEGPVPAAVIPSAAPSLRPSSPSHTTVLRI